MLKKCSYEELEHRIKILEKAESERKQAEEALNDNKKRLELSSESGGVGLWDLNLIDNTAWRSLKHDQIFGYETLLQKWTFEIFLHHVVEEDRSMVHETFEKAYNNIAHWAFECRIKRKDGVERWISVRGNPEVNTEQQPIRILGTILDITWQKQTEEALRKSEENMSTVLNHTNDLIVRIDHDFKNIFANAALYTATGLTPEQYLGKTNEETGLLPAHLCSFWRKKHQKVFTTGKPDYFEFNYSTIENGERTFQAAVCPEFNDNKEVETICSFMRDITELKLAESEKDAVIDKLEKALHEIKTLRGILPICASCKKIRDDKGYWNNLEAYFETHSDVLFSHGICKECSDKLYGDQDWYIDANNNEEI